MTAARVAVLSGPQNGNVNRIAGRFWRSMPKDWRGFDAGQNWTAAPVTGTGGGIDITVINHGSCSMPALGERRQFLPMSGRGVIGFHFGMGGKMRHAFTADHQQP